MKKYDSFFLSDKQIEQLKKTKQKPNKKYLIKSAILALISLASGLTIGSVSPLLGGVLQILTGTGAIAGVCSFVKAFERPDFEYDDETKSAIAELNKEERYLYGRRK